MLLSLSHITISHVVFSKAQVDYSSGWKAECQLCRSKKTLTFISLVRIHWPVSARHVNSYCKKCKLKEKSHIPLKHIVSLRTSVHCPRQTVFSREDLSDADFKASGKSTGDNHRYIYCFLSFDGCIYLCVHRFLCGYIIKEAVQYVATSTWAFIFFLLREVC